MDKANWWDNKENFRSLAASANQLLAMNSDPQIPIVCLGQSPAWLVRTAAELSALRGEQRRFDYLAFSSGFYYRLDRPLSRYHIAYEKTTGTGAITAEQISAYRTYLLEKHFDPQSLIDHFTKTGKPTVLIEFTESGSGLASFLGILFEWAREQGRLEALQKSVRIHAINAASHNGFHISNIDFPAEGVTFKSIPAPYVDTTLMNAMAISEDDRIVPEYGALDWGKRPSLQNKPDLVASIEKHIGEATKKFENERMEYERKERERKTAKVEAKTQRTQEAEEIKANALRVLIETKWELRRAAHPKQKSGIATTDARVTSTLLRNAGVGRPLERDGEIYLSGDNLALLQTAYRAAQEQMEVLVPEAQQRSAATENIFSQLDVIEQARGGLPVTSQYLG